MVQIPDANLAENSSENKSVNNDKDVKREYRENDILIDFIHSYQSQRKNLVDDWVDEYPIWSHSLMTLLNAITIIIGVFLLYLVFDKFILFISEIPPVGVGSRLVATIILFSFGYYPLYLISKGTLFEFKRIARVTRFSYTSLFIFLNRICYVASSTLLTFILFVCCMTGFIFIYKYLFEAYDVMSDDVFASSLLVIVTIIYVFYTRQSTISNEKSKKFNELSELKKEKEVIGKKLEYYRPFEILSQKLRTETYPMVVQKNQGGMPFFESTCLVNIQVIRTLVDELKNLPWFECLGQQSSKYRNQLIKIFEEHENDNDLLVFS